MTALFTVTAPLVVHYPDNTLRLMTEVFPHPDGILCFEPYWFETGPAAAHVITGRLQGEGPWKVGRAVIRLLSCSDTDLAMQWNAWQQYLAAPQAASAPYHEVEAIKVFARKLGADI